MFKRDDYYFVRVPLRTGGSVKRTTGTTDRRTASLIEGMVADLAARHDWQLLEAVTGGERRALGKRVDGDLSLGELYAAYVVRGVRGLDDLRASLSDVDLNEHVAGWLAWLRARLGPNAETATHYLMHVRTFMPADTRFPRTALTKVAVTNWLNSRPVSSATRRKYRASLSSFAKYLASVGVLDSNPVRDVEAPRAGKARDKFIEQPQVLELLMKLPEPFRTLEALIHGTGMEISAALAVRRSDVDPIARTARARGTKTAARDRTCVVSDWAWPYVERRLRDISDDADALLFPQIDRWRASDVHRSACKALGGAFDGYRLHDARRTYAVRLVRVGAPMEVAAAQLGHASTEMVRRVYARFKPKEEEIRRWEKLAEARDSELVRVSRKG